MCLDPTSRKRTIPPASLHTKLFNGLDKNLTAADELRRFGAAAGFDQVADVRLGFGHVTRQIGGDNCDFAGGVTGSLRSRPSICHNSLYTQPRGQRRAFGGRAHRGMC